MESGLKQMEKNISDFVEQRNALLPQISNNLVADEERASIEDSLDKIMEAIQTCKRLQAEGDSSKAQQMENELKQRIEAFREECYLADLKGMESELEKSTQRVDQAKNEYLNSINREPEIETNSVYGLLALLCKKGTIKTMIRNYLSNNKPTF